MLILIEKHLRPTQKTWACNLWKYVLSRIYGPSSRQTGDNGVGDTLVCPSINCRQKATTFPIWVQFLNLCDKTPVFPTQISYYESKHYSMYDSTYKPKSQKESYQSILSRTIITVVLRDMRNVPMKPLFQWDLPISIVSTL